MPREKEPTIEELQAQLAASNAELAAANATAAELRNKQARQSEEEKLIAAKTAKGLTRPQAIAIIARQKQYDASPVAQERAQRVPWEDQKTRTERAVKIQFTAAKPDTAKP
jgi:hypothetical protein